MSETPQKKTSADSSAPRKRRKARGCGAVFFCFIILIAAAWGACLGAFSWILEDAQSTIKALDEFRPKIGSKVYSSGEVPELLGEYTTEEWRQLVRLGEMPLYLQKAFVATEDDKFYEHKGVRPDAIVNAALYIARTGRIRGGSTITQQIVRNVAPLGLSQEQKIERKIKEAIIALQVEREYTKDEILELYLNQIFLGGSASGVEAASWQYFGKTCRDLTLGESAMLAGVARLPNKQRPDLHPENAHARRDIVLGQMLENGMITQEEHDAAVAESVEDAVITREERLERMLKGEGSLVPNEFQAPYYVEEVRKRLSERGVISKEQLLEQGLEIYTTIDMRMQRAAQKALIPFLEEYDEYMREFLKARNREEEWVPVTGALVCIDNRPGYEGYVRAMVGGRDWSKTKFNNATQAKRQPGSSVKPFVWASALQEGRHTNLNAATIMIDEPFVQIYGQGREWRPRNFEGTFRGPTTLRNALEHSVNIISVKLVERVGMPVVRSYMRDAGIETHIPDDVKLTLALGTPDITILEQCVAYSTLAKGGIYTPPTFVTEIRNRDGILIHDPRIERPRALPEDLCYVVTYLMEGVAQWGTGAASKRLDRPRAGKTGTSNESRNVWFCGFTPDFTCVVWVGYRDNRPMGWYKHRQSTGGWIACPVWTDFMIEAHKGLPIRKFVPPPTVQFYNIDKETGLLGGNFREAFLSGTMPLTETPVFPEEDELEQGLEASIVGVL
jgi:penicillin-binding protein 1A